MRNENSLDKYRIIAQLGRGGMADVYLAAAHGPGGFSKLMVVKVLQDTLARDRDFLLMFSDEARLAARLNHPNIVQTYEVGQAQGRHYIAMEYLEGQPLSRVIDSFSRVGGLSASMSLHIIIDALAGLHYAHELRGFDRRHLGIVHRDITPQNLFVTYEGQTKLVDFGIAKALDSTTHTQTGMVKGKIAYMAPEQARGEAVRRTADIFSMGVLLWEMLAGRRLWEGLTDIAVIGRLVQGTIPDLRAIRPDLPLSLCELVTKTLHPSPAGRPQTALALQRGLETIARKLPQPTSTRELADKMQEQFRAERAQVGAVVSKQLERLARSSPGDVTPPGGFPMATANAGDMPILGEAGSAVHNAVTTVHTGMLAAPPPSARTMGAQNLPTGTTDAKLIAQNRNFMWVAICAVGLGGLAVGAAQPWKHWTSAGARASDAPKEILIEGAQASMVGNANPVRPATSPGCERENKPLVELSGEINDDAELSCENDYLLRFTTYVTPGATLSIQPGTRLLGDLDTKGTLVVQPGGQIHAAGTAQQPIVFTSAAQVGAKKPGDWGGLIVLGNAPINLKNDRGASRRGRIEGLTDGGEYGGDDAQDSSGVLSFIRIEYSGTEIAPNNEINGLTLGGVGRGTVLNHVQVRHTTDDCFEFFGGTVDAKYLVCQAAGDDAFDWDYGYRGRLQFLVALADPKVKSGSNGFEGDNDPNASKNAPVSAPLIYNVTLCGKSRRMPDKEHYGMLLRRGSEVRLRNAIFQGFGSALDVRDEGTKPNIAASIFFGNLVDNLAMNESTTVPRSDKEHFDDDGGFDEKLYLKNEGLKVSELDPHVPNCFDQQNAGFKPQYPLIEGSAIPPNDGFFDHDARYIGAFRDANDDWDAGNWIAWGSAP